MPNNKRFPKIEVICNVKKYPDVLHGFYEINKLSECLRLELAQKCIIIAENIVELFCYDELVGTEEDFVASKITTFLLVYTLYLDDEAECYSGFYDKAMSLIRKEKMDIRKDGGMKHLAFGLTEDEVTANEYILFLYNRFQIIQNKEEILDILEKVIIQTNSFNDENGYIKLEKINDDYLVQLLFNSFFLTLLAAASKTEDLQKVIDFLIS